jgi:hypothetical protein
MLLNFIDAIISLSLEEELWWRRQLQVGHTSILYGIKENQTVKKSTSYD